MSKKLFLIHQAEPILADYFLPALFKERFIERCDLETPITISETEANATFRELYIENLNFSDEILDIWKINLERKTLNLEGIGTSGATPETALLILYKKPEHAVHTLFVLFIELKSSLGGTKTVGSKLKLSTLTQCEGKFRCGMNRLYMLLNLERHKNLQKACQAQIVQIKFLGLIAYGTNAITTDDGSTIFNFLQTPTKSGLLTVETILNPNDKIAIKLFENKPKISLKEAIF